MIDTNLIAPELDLMDGAVDGTGDLTVTGTLDWTGGEMQGTGTTTIPSGGTLALTGNGTQILSRELDNAGTINWTGGTLAFNNALINNYGTFDVGDVPGNSLHTGQLNNEGTFAKTAGTGTTSLAIQVFNNTGIVQVDSGTLDFSSPSNAPITQMTGTTLTGGTWNLLNGGSLLFPAGITIATNQADITLAGTSASFPALGSLSSESGSLTLSNGASFTTPGNLDNSGTIILGSSATLGVNGALTEESTAALDVKFGGASSSGNFGTLTATGQITLGGTLGLALANGFVPANGESFQIVSDAGETGSFASISRTSAGAGQLLAVAVNATDVTVTRQGAGSNLAVTNVMVQPTGVVGQNTTVSYTVENEDPSSTNVTSWQDSVYLSTTLSPSAVLIGRVGHSGTVAGDGSYTGTITAALPGVAAGSYRVIVVADSQGQVTDTNRANGVLASSSEISVQNNALVPGAAVSGTIGSGEQVYYQLAVAAGSAVTLTLTTPSPGGAGLFALYQAEPTSSDYDDYAFNSTSTTQTIAIPGTQTGTYYIMVSGGAPSGSGAGYSLTAAVQSFGIFSFAPASDSNQGQATVTLNGSKFTPSTSVSLVSPIGGAATPASQVIDQDDSTLFATFNLSGLAPGAYHVQASSAGSHATASALFTVNTAAPGNLWLHMNLPVGIFANVPTPVTVTYANTGATDIPAPILVFSADAVQVRLASQDTFSGNTVDFLGIDPTGPAGVLPPGASGSETLVLEGSLTGSTGVNLSVGPVDPTQNVEWSGFQSDGPPAFTGTEAWGQIVANLQSLIGTTEGQLQSALDSVATYLGMLGERTNDVDTLFSQEILNADAELPITTLGTQTDASVPTPGSLSLDFTRTFMQPLSGREALGPFGLGWSDDWDIVASTDTSGNVTVDYAGTIRTFTLLPGGTFQSQPGDFGTLTRLSSGGLQLEEQDGTLEVFNSGGTLEYEKDTNGNRITAGYDSNGRLTTLTASSGQSLAIAYNAAGLVSSVTDSYGRVATYAYDASEEHLQSVTTPQGTTQYTYNEQTGTPTAGALQSIALSDGTQQVLTYDALGRIATIALNGGAEKETFTYGPPGQITVTDALGNSTELDYNEFGEVAKEVDALGKVTSIDFDPATLLPTQVTNSLGQTESYTYSAEGNLLSVTDPAGNTTSYTYGIDNQITSMTDAGGNTTTYAYDSSGNQLTTTLPDGTTSTSTFNPLGEPISYVSADGEAVSTVYNASGQMTQETLSDGTVYTYTYDAHGNLATATDASGTTTFTYNAADELTEVSYPNGEFLKFTLDATGRRTQMVDQTGYTVNYQYTADGQLAGLTDSNGNPIVTYTYNADDELTRTDNGNGTYTTYAYDGDGNVLSVLNFAPAGSLNSSFVYTYNAVGEVATMTTSYGEWTYTYDPDGELIQAVLDSTDPSVPSQDQTYTYNAAGDRTSTVVNGVTTTYTSNDVNEYTSVGGTTDTYDAAGNLISDGTNSYRYNALNELTSVTTPTGTTIYAYDALGNHSSVTTNGQTTQYLVDPTGFGGVLGTVVGAFDGSGNTIAQYTYGLGLVSQVTASGNYYYDFDALGSTADMTNATGSVVASYAYNPFGSLLASSGTVANPFTFIGNFGVSAGAGGLLHMSYRDYDPATGQFASNDPSGLAGGDTNIRRYAGASPTDFIDPSGLSDQASGPVSGPPPFTGYDADASGGFWSATVNGNRFYSYNSADYVMRSVWFNDWDFEDIYGPQKYWSEFNPYHGTPMPEIPPPRIPAGAVAAPAAGAAGRLGGALGAAGRLAGPIGLGISGVQNASGLGYSIGKLIGMIPAVKKLDAYLASLFSSDPNDLIGPAGYGSQGFVTPNQTLNYTIDFENKPIATAPVQQAVVTEQLSTGLDWSTFGLGDIGFGNITVQVPPGRTSYQTVVDATASVGVLVSIAADLNPLTGLVTWTFTSLDPTTLDTPSNSLEGFLPPDKSPPMGDAYVSYSINPKASDPTGTTLSAQASVVFDTNAPLATPTATNTIDTGPPTSSVSPLPLLTTSNSFTVNMTGADDPHGSGIASFALYVSDDGGPFKLFQAGISAELGAGSSYTASVAFPGITGHTYAFYSVATDNVGHIQSTPTAAEATTQVIAIPPPVTVTSVQFATMKVKVGKGKKVKTKAEKVLEVQFSGSLSGAGNLAAYEVLSGTTKKHVTTFKKPVPLESAVYNPSTLTVTLAPKSQFNLAGPEQLRITAADLTDSYGRALDGNDDGAPGGNFAATLNKSEIASARVELKMRVMPLSALAVDSLFDSERVHRLRRSR